MGLFENICKFQRATAQSQLAVPRPGTVSTIGHGQLAGLHVGARVSGRHDPADPPTVAFS